MRIIKFLWINLVKRKLLLLCQHVVYTICCRMLFDVHNCPDEDWWPNSRFRVRVSVHLDFIIITTPAFEHNYGILQKVLNKFYEAGLTLNRETCVLLKPQLNYIGYLVTNYDWHTDLTKIESMISYPTWQCVKVLFEWSHGIVDFCLTSLLVSLH